jgi:hypothetical protein
MTDDDIKALVVPPSATRRTEHDGDAIEVGQWYWVDMQDPDDVCDDEDVDVDEDAKPDPWLVCVVRIGSNFVEFRAANTTTKRVHADHFHDLCTYEPNPDRIIQRRIDVRQGNVRELMDKIHRVTAALGITPRLQLGEVSLDEDSKALATVSGSKAPKEYQKALVKAKEETLPALFKEVEEEHRIMTMWMKARFIPMRAEQYNQKKSMGVIDDRIFAVELYAGLVENLEQVKKGTPAPLDAKIHVHQRRHYMDEECLVSYKAGGMEFKDIRAFDRWLCRKTNLERILPHPRTVVAFRVRRHKKDYEVTSLSDFIEIAHKVMADRKTLLYIRNGQQVFRLMTEVEFGEKLFPDTQYAITLNQDNALWFQMHCVDKVDGVISDDDYQERIKVHAKAVKAHKKAVKAWKAEPEADRSYFGPRCESDFRPKEWFPCNPTSVYYDDAMQSIADNIRDHNRIVVLLQGLLDRAMAFHPHPPWQLWSPDGFAQAIELVHDASRVLTSGDPPDFEEYRSRLNLTLGKGCFTVGQQELWEIHEAEKENDRTASRGGWGGQEPHRWKRYTPYGNPGPGEVAEVTRFSRKYECSFAWMRKRQTYSYLHGYEKPIRATFTCPSNKLLNVSAYQPGDFKIFYSDPRTRADYLKWAPLLLTAEDWHAAKAKERKGKKVRGKKKNG